MIVACASAPDDDRPRMVYADFLQQRGDPRGDFIALQCAYELARAAEGAMPLAEQRRVFVH
ncbi:MAG TPA: TIGR02996 domain-containing protein [Kofleriaceae bacterium]